jgi:predicted aconitase with swiveling domain
MIVETRALTSGTTEAQVLLLDTPLSLWGGVDLQSSEIVDRTHPQQGTAIANRILAMRSARGSSSSSSALVEIARVRRAPAAIILGQYDPILVMGALVADELYGVKIPIVLWEDSWTALVQDQRLHIDADETRARIKFL